MSDVILTTRNSVSVGISETSCVVVNFHESGSSGDLSFGRKVMTILIALAATRIFVISPMVYIHQMK